MRLRKIKLNIQNFYNFNEKIKNELLQDKHGLFYLALDLA